MKFEVSSAVLLSRLQPIGKVISTKNALPILDCFLFDLEWNMLTVTASDSETRLVTSVELMSSQGTGSVAVPAKVLLEPLKELPEQPITFDINEKTFEILIHFRNGKYNFIGQDAGVYPQPSLLKDNAVSASMDAQTLLGGISCTLFATGDDELRPVMNGIYFDFQADGLTFVATDSHKLVRLHNTAVKSSESAAFILPKKPSNLLRSLLAKETGEVSVKFDDSNVYVTCTGFEMVCRQIEGRYPNYNSVIPKDHPLKVTVNRSSLLNALKRVSVFSNPNSSMVQLNFKDGQITAIAQDIDFSTSAEENIGCEFAGAELSIGFKVTNLIEILGNISSEEVVIELDGPSKAGLIVPSKNEENIDLLMLLMPMLLGD